jgi:hypothetical protein
MDTTAMLISEKAGLPMEADIEQHLPGFDQLEHHSNGPGHSWPCVLGSVEAEAWFA